MSFAAHDSAAHLAEVANSLRSARVELTTLNVLAADPPRNCAPHLSFRAGTR